MMKKIIVALIFVCVGLPQAGFAIPGFIKDRMGTISGQVMYDAKPLPGVIVAFFDVKKGLPPIKGTGYGVRIPEVILFSDDQGRFSHKLLQGKYYLGALVRVTEPRLGPPREGEPFYLAQDATGGLLTLAIQDFQQRDYGPINCALSETFSESEDSFRVEGTVLKGAQKKKPFPGAIVLAKTSKSLFKRPEYVSAQTGKDGKFSLTLRPGPTYYLLARTTLTGMRPKPGDNIGRYNAEPDTDENPDNLREQAGPPPGVAENQAFRALNQEVLSVSGKTGQLISGVTIYMYDMPDNDPTIQRLIQKEIRKTAGVTRFAEGVAMKVLFATNSHTVNHQSFRELDEWARFLKGNRGLLIELSGHTDNAGDAEYNLALSKNRADAVAQYLIDKGVDSLRIKVIGYGLTMPVTDNSTAERRHENRRVEIKFIR